MSIKGLDTWFIHVDFFLAQKVQLANGPQIDVFSFECSEEQFTLSGAQSRYELQKRSWFRGPEWIYDVDKVIHETRAGILQVHFTIRSAKTLVELSQKRYTWHLDYQAAVQPLYQDYCPRDQVLWEFSQLTTNGKPDLEPLDIERFFKAFTMAALHSTYVNNPTVLDYRKPIPKGLLNRLVQWISKMPSKSKAFEETFDLEKEPVVIADQRLDDPVKDPEEVGNIIVVLTLKKPDAAGNLTRSFRW